VIVLRRRDDGYEEARRASVRNARVPDRYPDLIVQAETDDDVIAAVRLAREKGMQIGVRSGGHSWAASFLRDGGVLLDLSRMHDAAVDPVARLAAVQPGLTGTALNRRLAEHDLFFPTGHCTNVGLGGFLLQGGFGWNSRLWGPACQSVRAIDVVSADGELVRADESQNADYFWAARGAGPGFFGVVTRFHLDLYARPAAMVSSYLYPIDVLDEVLRWTVAIQPSLPRTMELMVFLRRGLAPGTDEPAALVMGPVLADSAEAAIEDLAILESCPVRGRALASEVNMPTTVDELLAGSDDFYPLGSRYAVDNMWTEAPVAELLPGMRRIASTLPASPSHVMWLLWGPPEARPDMAFSMEANVYVGLYAIWDDETDDARHESWVADQMCAMEPLAAGIQLADENLGARPSRFMADDNLRRLEAVRAQRDPKGLFHSYMGTARS
jgi:FAD/FMN-containing dehydrogenase